MTPPLRRLTLFAEMLRNTGGYAVAEEMEAAMVEILERDRIIADMERERAETREARAADRRRLEELAPWPARAAHLERVLNETDPAKNGELQRAEQEIRARDAAVSDLRNELIVTQQARYAERDRLATLGAAEERCAALKRELADVKAARAAEQERIHKLAPLEVKVAVLTAELEDVRDARNLARQRIDELHPLIDEVAALKRALAERDARIATLSIPPPPEERKRQEIAAENRALKADLKHIRGQLDEMGANYMASLNRVHILAPLEAERDELQRKLTEVSQARAAEAKQIDGLMAQVQALAKEKQRADALAPLGPKFAAFQKLLTAPVDVTEARRMAYAYYHNKRKGPDVALAAAGQQLLQSRAEAAPL